MNRPNKETLTEWSLNSYADYTNDLEKYCDELENKIKSLIELGKSEMGCEMCISSSHCMGKASPLEIWLKDMEEVIKR